MENAITQIVYFAQDAYTHNTASHNDRELPARLVCSDHRNQNGIFKSLRTVRKL